MTDQENCVTLHGCIHAQAYAAAAAKEATFAALDATSLLVLSFQKLDIYARENSLYLLLEYLNLSSVLFESLEHLLLSSVEDAKVHSSRRDVVERGW